MNRVSKLRDYLLLCVAALLTSGCGVGLCAKGCATALASAVLELNVVARWQRLELGWSSSSGAAGYLLVRNPGTAVSWKPVDGEQYEAGYVAGTHSVVASGAATTVTDATLTNGSSYHYAVFSFNGAYQYTAGATATGTPGIACPTSYMAVGPNTTVGVTDAFCVAKYEMKNDGSNGAVSQAAGTPWVSITRDDNGTPGAISRCRNIGTAYDLISNSQWQALAREIELAQSGTNYVNWSNASTAGANAINRGHSDFIPLTPLAGSSDSDPCFGTSNSNCANNTHADFTQKRTHLLDSGETIWDVAGNVFEWVKDDIAPGPPEGTGAYVSQQPWTSGLNQAVKWAPFGSYTSKNSGEYGGLGFASLGFTTGAILRGGAWYDFPNSGVFAAYLNHGPLHSDPNYGFRCVWVP